VLVHSLSVGASSPPSLFVATFVFEELSQASSDLLEAEAEDEIERIVFETQRREKKLRTKILQTVSETSEESLVSRVENYVKEKKSWVRRGQKVSL
jgi:hypothetical protein